MEKISSIIKNLKNKKNNFNIIKKEDKKNIKTKKKNEK